MATVYKIEIKTVSDWVNYSPKELEKIILDVLDSETNLVCTDVDVIRVA